MNSSGPDEEAIFHAARSIPDSVQRAAYLDQVCGDDAGLRRRLDQLIAAVDQDRGSFENPPVAEPTKTTAPDPEPAPPRPTVGPYKLLQTIGEGGMGTVFMAEQTKPVQRKVALKIIKAGMDTVQVIARFEAERQALAMMEHPNIAKVFDAGTTSPPCEGGGGRPYFVMELVKGVPITQYCDLHRLKPADRLALFVPVCQAVQHAHQKGVVHRDLKPSNVLVALYDGKPVPKVIDFGVAKATGQQLTERTLFTEFGQVVGTLEYMSPEAAQLNQLDIDTRSDIYSLGVLLYELLTGTTPLQRNALERGALVEMLRLIREEEPPKPSTRLSATDQLPTIAANRGLEPTRLTGLLRGELDWIVMKCLEKDRDRRYETASGLALDLERYLSDEPVQAGPPSARYRLKKLAHRHRRALRVAAMLAAVLVAATVVSTWQAIRARNAEAQALLQRNRAEVEKRRALESSGLARAAVDRYFTQVSESKELKVRGLETLRKQLLQDANKFYQEFIERHGNEAALQSELGRAHVLSAKINKQMGLHTESEAHAREAHRIFQGLVAAQPDSLEFQRSLAWSQYRIALAQLGSGQKKQAESGYREVIALLEKLLARQPGDLELIETLAFCYNDLAILCNDSNRVGEAESSLRQTIELKEQLVSRRPQVAEYRDSLAISHVNLAAGFFDTGRLEAAESSYRRAIALEEEVIRQRPGEPEFQAVLSTTYMNLGDVCRMLGRQEEAESNLRRALAIKETLAREHPEVIEYAFLLATCHHALGELQSERRAFDRFFESNSRATELCRRVLAREPRHAWAREQLQSERLARAIVLARTGKSERALEAAEEIAASEEVSANNLFNLACVYAQAAQGAANDRQPSGTERDKVVGRYADRAMNFLEQARKQGYRNTAALARDKNLDPLRSRADFKQFLTDAEPAGKR
jgi:serine/threonine protein kinase